MSWTLEKQVSDLGHGDGRKSGILGVSEEASKDAAKQRVVEMFAEAEARCKGEAWVTRVIFFLLFFPSVKQKTDR